MRLVLLGVAALALAACDSGSIPSPADRMEGYLDEAAAIDPGSVALSGEGLTAGSESFFFAAGQTEVEAALSRALGKASDMVENAECEAGPMSSASFPGGLTVNFQNGNWVGWNLRDGAKNISVSGPIELGLDRAELQAIPGYSPIEDSTLGEEFFISGDVAGFVEDAQEEGGEVGRVAMIYAGVQCFFR